MNTNREIPSLTRDDIRKGTDKGLEKYKDLGFMEKYSMYMGVTQILEIQLKRLLVNLYGYDFNRIENWTLGMIHKELMKNKLRSDFIVLLENTVRNRNYVAHELLANKFIFHDILGDKTPEDYIDRESRHLNKFIYELEHLVFLFDWTNSNDGWL